MSSSEEESISSLSDLKHSKKIQNKVDKQIADLEKTPTTKGNESIRSKRGGLVDVTVKKRVAWPHESILGGPSRQRITFDQMSLTQFVQGFSRNILEEKDGEIRECMIRYLNELMEDATDFSWSNAKAAHAVLLCDMERGIIQWGDTDKIDRIRRAQTKLGQNIF